MAILDFSGRVVAVTSAARDRRVPTALLQAVTGLEIGLRDVPDMGRAAPAQRVVGSRDVWLRPPAASGAPVSLPGSIASLVGSPFPGMSPVRQGLGGRSW